MARSRAGIGVERFRARFRHHNTYGFRRRHAVASSVRTPVKKFEDH